MKQKHFIYYILLGTLMGTASSCEKFLDRQPDNKLSEEQVFTNWDRVNGEANKLYRDMRDRDKGIVTLQDFSIAGITDEAKGTR